MWLRTHYPITAKESVFECTIKRPVSYSNGLVGSSMKWRLMRGKSFHIQIISPPPPPLGISFPFFLNPIIEFFFFGGGGGLHLLKQWIPSSLKHDTVPRAIKLYCFLCKEPLKIYCIMGWGKLSIVTVVLDFVARVYSTKVQYQLECKDT